MSSSSKTADRHLALVWPRLPWWLELVTMGIAYVIYEASRALTAPQQAVAIDHGNAIVQAEKWAHLDPEVTLNHWLNLWDPLSDAAGYYYSTMHFLITPLVLVYLWWRRPGSYPRIRSALVLTTVAALVVYITWPVAPPRLTNLGITDTLVQHHIFGMSDPHGVTALINQYAAMPSLHVGWAVWCAAAIVATNRSPWRHLAWIYPVTTTLVVLATGNHFLFDAIGGALLVSVALAWTSAAANAQQVRGPSRDDLAAGGAGPGPRDSKWRPRHESWPAPSTDRDQAITVHERPRRPGRRAGRVRARAAGNGPPS